MSGEVTIRGERHLLFRKTSLGREEVGVEVLWGEAMRERIGHRCLPKEFAARGIWGKIVIGMDDDFPE